MRPLQLKRITLKKDEYENETFLPFLGKFAEYQNKNDIMTVTYHDIYLLFICGVFLLN